MKSVVWSGMLVAAVAALSWSAPEKSKAGGLTELSGGAYQATVKAIVCDGCGEFIQKAIREHPGIEAVVVDQKARKVTFRVKEGATIAVADLQKTLKASADRMGMGANYTLSNLKKFPAGKAAATPAPAAESSGHSHHH